jgi:hypothetical protein
MEKEELKRAEETFDKVEAHILECHEKIKRLEIDRDCLELQNFALVNDVRKLVNMLCSVDFLSYQSPALRKFVERMSNSAI